MFALIAGALAGSLAVTQGAVTLSGSVSLWPGPAGAPTRGPALQEPAREPSLAADGRDVTEQELLASLGSEHPAFAALEERIGIADAGVLASEAIAAPELSVAREDPSGGGGPGVEQIDVTVAWELPLRSRRATIEAARLRAGAARAGVDLARLALRGELRAVFAEWAIAAEHVRIRAQYAERLGALAARERTRADRGEVSGLGARRLELAAADAAAQLAFARAEAEAARQVVAGWNATLAQGRPVVPGAPAPIGPEATVDAGAHPQLLAIERELEAARLERQAARRLAALPELIAGWQRQDDGDASLDGPLLGFSWRVPIVDANRGARAAAAARVAGAEARLEHARSSLRAEREAARASLNVLVEALAAARESAALVVPLVTGTVRAFELGELELLELLDVLRSAVESEERVVELLDAALAADRRLELLTAAGP